MAAPGLEARCPGCSGLVIAKCGAIRVWHWCHAHNSDCDSWYQPETQWHSGWKLRAHKACCEVVLGPHRADILGNNNTVIELQHSKISVGAIEAREAFYGNMVWLFDAKEFAHNIEIRFKNIVNRPSYYTFRWKRPRKSMWACQRPVYLDFGIGTDPDSRIFKIKKLHKDKNCAGWGYYISEQRFIDTYFPISDAHLNDYIAQRLQAQLVTV